MRIGVIPWLVGCPVVLVVGCFGLGEVELGPPDAGTGGAASSSASMGGAGGTGGAAGGTTSSAGGAASSSSATGTGGSGGGMATCPASMVLIGGGVTDYCIDSTEVTNAQYATWLASKPAPSVEPSECMGNPFLPATGEPPMDAKPVANVDWCDAYAYCKSNNKRLCGKIGGGSNVWSDWNKPGLSQWHKVCTMNGAMTFPYGNTYNATACNVDETTDAGANAPWSVGTVATCQGGYPGVFDMSGNVWEWEDSCETGVDAGTERCRRRGGGFTSQEIYVACDIGGTQGRTESNDQTGFRCCKDL